MLIVEIRRNSDGVVRRYRDDLEWHGDFIWSEGNFSCDCNRGLFFARAENADESDIECGDSAYSVRIKNADGDTLYQDDDWES